MCGIVGVVGFASPEEGRARVTRMNQAIIHRGPDDEGVWAGEGVAFGMRRLSIIDLAGGHQPMWTDDGVGIVFNGEIYNYRALRRELEDSGYAFLTHSDTEVLLKLYHRDGLAGIRRLEGMFAVCLYDLRRGELHLVRDRLGVKPLYYAQQEGKFWFGSEIKALLAGFGRRPGLNPSAFHHYLTLRFVPGPETVWQDIHKLPPGHCLTLRLGDGTIELMRYWNLAFHSLPEDPGRDYQGEFEALFLGAVEKRLLAADVPVGVLLSGGLDSSAVSAAAVELGHRDFHTFSVAFDEGGDFDESAHARQVAEHLGARHHEIRIGQDVFMASLPDHVKALDEPLADLASIPLYHVSRLAREEVKVVLSGEGSDEILAGYNFDRLARAFSWLARLERLPAFSLRLMASIVGKGRAGRALTALARGGSRAVLPSLPYHMTFHWGEEEKRRLWRGPAVAGTTEDLIRSWYAAAVPGAHGLDALQQVYCGEWLVEDLLMKADKMSMAASLELREPFLDHLLVEWAATLPLAWKIGRPGAFTSKRILREFARKRLPAEIITRPKRGFPVPAYGWLGGSLRGFAAPFLTGPEARVTDWLDPVGVREAVEAAENGDLSAAHRVWLLIVLEHWMRAWC